MLFHARGYFGIASSELPLNIFSICLDDTKYLCFILCVFNWQNRK
jgi:hypothetical protein